MIEVARLLVLLGALVSSCASDSAPATAGGGGAPPGMAPQAGAAGSPAINAGGVGTAGAAGAGGGTAAEAGAGGGTAAGAGAGGGTAAGAGAGGAPAAQPIWSSTSARIELECGGGLLGCTGNDTWGADAADLTDEQVQMLSRMAPIPESPILPCDTSAYYLTVIEETGTRTRYLAPLSWNYCTNSAIPELDVVQVRMFLETING